MGLSWSLVCSCYPRTPFVPPPLSQLSTCYRILYLLYVRHTHVRQRTHLSQLWYDTLHLRCFFFRLRSAAKHLGFCFEDPFVFIVHNVAYSVDDDLCALKHAIRDSYRQFYLAKASQRRQDCLGQTQLIDVVSTRAYYLSLQNPIHQAVMRHVLTGSLDHASRIYRSKLVSSPVCPYCNICDETAEHIFWHCPRLDNIRSEYSNLLRLFSLVGTQWPKCFRDTHRMFLRILLARRTASQVLRSTPQTPPNHFTPPSTPHTIQSSPSSCVQLPGDVSPISLVYSSG